MIGNRFSFCVAAALTGGAIASAFAPNVAWAGCTTAGSNDNTIQFGNVIAGTVNAVSSVVTTITTTDVALVAQGSSAFVAGSPSQVPNQVGGGVWARGAGGNLLTNVPSNGTIDDGVIKDDIECQSRVRQGFAGAQVGADVANMNLGGSGGTLHVGLTSGFLETSAVSNSPASLNFQVPFFGLYSSLIYGGFFADAQIRGNFFEGSITDQLNNIPAEKLNARGFTLNGNIGYHHNLPADWFIEPSVGVGWSRTFVDAVSFQGTAIFHNNIPSTAFAGPSTLAIDSFDNILGRASLRVGTTFTNGRLIWQPFFTASVLHEFAAPIQSTLIGVHDVDAPFVTTNLSTGRIGTFAQFGLGASGQITDTGWAGFVRGDYRTGSRFEGWSVAGGARYDFVPETGAIVQGRSVDMAVTPEPVPYDWTGFFLGVSAPGAFWGETKWSFRNGGNTIADNYSGLLVGGGGGYNYQVGALVVGAQVEWDWTNARGGASFSGGNSFSCPINSLVNNPTGGRRGHGALIGRDSLSCTTRMDSLFAATARLGYAIDRLLVFGEAGLALGNVAANIVSNSFVPGGTLVSASKTPVGWTIGGGFELGLTKNISAKAEYLYVGLGSDNYDLGVPVSINRNGNIGRLGLNYRFD